MLPAKTFKHLVFINKVAYKFGAVIFRFVKDPITKEIQPVPDLRGSRKFYVHATFVLQMLYITFLLLRLFHQILFCEDYTIKFVVKMTYQIFGYVQIAVIHFNTLYMFRESISFVIWKEKAFKKIKEKFMLPDVIGPKCTKFFYAWYVVGFIVNSQNCVLIFKKPYRHHYLTSLLDNPKKAPIIYRLPLVIIHLIIWSSGWSTVLCLCFHLYSYMACLVWIIREMDVYNKDPKTRKSLREPKIFSEEVRTLQVLHHMWLHAHQSFFCPAHKLVAIMVATLGTYGLITLSGPVAILMGCMAAISTLYLWTLFSKFGQLYTTSKDVLENWQNSSRSSKWLKKFVRSVPIFCVDIGSFYRVERMTVFTALETILDNTITLLFL